MTTTRWNPWLAGVVAAAFAVAMPTGETIADGEEPKVTVTPMVRYVTVDGDEKKFREDWWIQDDWAGGLEDLTLTHKLWGDWDVYLEGRAIFDEEDYRVRLEIVNPQVGFVRGGYTEYRKYFDDTGGFFGDFSTPSFDLGRDLHLDIGNAYVEVGLTLPDWPKIVLGYEHRFRDGTKSMIEWGSVSEGGETRKIFPATKDVDETVDIFTAHIEHDISNVHVGDKFRYENYRITTRRLDDAQLALPATSPDKIVTVDEHFSYDLFSNVFYMNSHVNEKVYWSMGYLFTTMDGDGGIALDTEPFSGRFDKEWFTRKVLIDQDSHVVNVNAMFGPFRGLSIYGGFQAEKTETDGFTDGNLRERNFANVIVEPDLLIDSRNDKTEFQERIGVRYTRIPYTTVYAEGKWTQGSTDLFERELEGPLGTPPEDLEVNFERFTDTDIERQEYKVGFNTAPIRRVTLAGSYRRLVRENDYDHLIDQEESNGGFVPHEGYSAFITRQELTTDEIAVKLTVRPTPRVGLSFKYQLVATDFDTRHDAVPSEMIPAGSLQSGNYDLNIYSVSVTATPMNRLYWTGLFSFYDTRTTAFVNDSPSVLTYHGDAYTLASSVGYALDEKTDLTAQYTFSWSDNFEDNSADGLPVGIDNERHGLLFSLTRRINENMAARLRYGFYYYNETSNGGVDDYRAHLASASWTFRF